MISQIVKLNLNNKFINNMFKFIDLELKRLITFVNFRFKLRNIQNE